MTVSNVRFYEARKIVISELALEFIAKVTSGDSCSRFVELDITVLASDISALYIIYFVVNPIMKIDTIF